MNSNFRAILNMDNAFLFVVPVSAATKNSSTSCLKGKQRRDIINRLFDPGS